MQKYYIEKNYIIKRLFSKSLTILKKTLRGGTIIEFYKKHNLIQLQILFK